MGWSRTTRRPDRGRCRPNLEGLEARLVLSSYSGASAADGTIGASATRNLFGVDGKGETAAVIDTGVNYRHEALGDGFGAGAKVRGGYDFADHSPDPDAKTWDHGTAVAGLIASDDPAHPGVAPGADIVALRVFGDNNQGNFDDVAKALQWVIDNHTRYAITVANLSLSDGNNYPDNWFAHDGGIGERISGLIQKLVDLNIPVVSAAGNSFQGRQGMGFTAILDQTISVTATDATDHLAADAQRLGASLNPIAATDLAAPGTGLDAPIDGNSFATVDGTSFSAAEVSGAVILLQQIYESRFGHLPAVPDLVGWLKAGSDPVYDPVTGITVGRLDIPKAAALIPQPTPPAQSTSRATARGPEIHPTPASVPTPAPGSEPARIPGPPTVEPKAPPAAVPTGRRPQFRGIENPWNRPADRIASRPLASRKDRIVGRRVQHAGEGSGPAGAVVGVAHHRVMNRFRWAWPPGRRA